MNQLSDKNYFTMPNEIFPLGLDASEIAVYDHLLCLEDRRTYQCWPSDTTMDNAVGRAKNTVMRYVDVLAEKGLIYTEPTSILMCATPPDLSVRPWNSSILVRWQLECAAERQQLQRKLSAMNLLPGT